MSFVDGMANFDVRKDGDLPLVYPYEKDGGDTTAIKKYHPVVVTSAQIVRRGTATASGSGFYLTDAKIHGFAAEDDQNTTRASELPAHFPRMPAINRPNGRPRQNVMPAAPGVVFSARVCSGQITSPSFVGRRANLKYDSTLDQFTIDPTSQQAAWFQVTIVGIKVGQDNTMGVFDFIVEAGETTFQTG